MKTALMELISELHQWAADKYCLYSEEQIKVVRDVINRATELLQKERQQIEEAVDSVCIVSRRYYSGGGFGDDDLGKEITSPDINNDGNDYFGLSITGSDYYTKTFTNESK